MGQVRVDPDKLEAAADSISRNREAMERVIRELLQVTFELQMSWEGIAHQRFFDEFFSKKRSMDDLVKHLHHTELELKKSAKTFREVDEKAYGNFNLLNNLSDAFLRGSGRAAGTKVAELTEFASAENGVTIFGEYNGVRVGVIKTDGEIGTIFPDATQQP
ncbi:WXG100 family type VII secretion target [Bacillus sp. 491mf]|uniref:WXG100 family type VII secretion target n=1 Tax=Bacillus sp. 491mf TaxID=1761755 RepID=UPI000B88B3C6|nr:WXG100 family type VII secretion target [Bacillus sp. 491mf]